MKLKHGKFLDPKADVVFRKIFGQNKDLVKSFLNNLLPLPDDGLIETVEYLPSEQIPRTPFKKYSIVDVRCVDQRGRQFIVEMQMGWSESFKQRIQFGASKAYVSQLEAGEHYQLLQPVYGLALIGEIFKPTSDEWYHHFQMVNIKDTEDQIKGLELIFVELPKFKPTARWERYLGILWLRFLNEISTLEEVPVEMEAVPEISKAIQLTREAAYNDAELAEYDGYWDLISIDKTIKVDAEQKGRMEGLIEGEKLGLVKGEKLGLAKGEQKAKRELYLKKVARGKTEEQILDEMEITPHELEALKAESFN